MYQATFALQRITGRPVHGHRYIRSGVLGDLCQVVHGVSDPSNGAYGARSPITLPLRGYKYRERANHLQVGIKVSF